MPSELDIFQSLPRRARRKVSRDQARKHPIAPLPPRGHEVADRVNAPRPMAHRIATPRSGQLRINTKRNERAAYWHTVKVRVSAEMEPYFRQHLHLFGCSARVLGRTPIVNQWSVELDVHIPGAPTGAVAADPVYQGVFRDGRYEPELNGMQWFDADGELMEFPDAVLVAAS